MSENGDVVRPIWNRGRRPVLSGAFDTAVFPADNPASRPLGDAFILERVIRNRFVPVYP